MITDRDDAAIRAHVLFMRRCDARADTIRGREGLLRRLAAVLTVGLLDADTAALWDWQDDLRGRLAIASVRCYTSHVKGFFRWAVEHGWVERDPTQGLRTPRVPPGRGRPIGEDALRVAIRCASEPSTRTWLILAAYCGLRAGEIARLRGQDVGEETLDLLGKGGRRRTVPLPAGIRAGLVEYVHGPGPIWRTPGGRPFAPSAVSRRCCDHLHRCGFPATLHQLRHRYATRVYDLSKDVLMVKDLLGHASLATTQVYLEVSVDRARACTTELAGALTA